MLDQTANMWSTSGGIESTQFESTQFQSTQFQSTFSSPFIQHQSTASGSMASPVAESRRSTIRVHTIPVHTIPVHTIQFNVVKCFGQEPVSHTVALSRRCFVQMRYRSMRHVHSVDCGASVTTATTSLPIPVRVRGLLAKENPSGFQS